MVLAIDAMEPLIVAAAALSRGVLVAAAGVVVVLAILLVFVMVLRGAGSSRQKASGLDYDAQQGPLGQPQGAPRDAAQAGAAPWGGPTGQMGQANDRFDAMDQGFGPPTGQGRPAGAGQQAPGWGTPFAEPAQANGGAWGAPDMAQNRWNEPMAPAGQMGQMGGLDDWANPPSQGRGAPPAWDAPAGAANTGAGWNGAGGGQGMPAARPSAAAAGGAANPWDAQPPTPWDAPAAAAPSQPAWGAPQPGMGQQPWDAPGAAAPGQPSWGGQPPAAANPQPWDAPAPPSQPGWGAPPAAAPSQPAWGAPQGGMGQQPWDAPAGPTQPGWSPPADDGMMRGAMPRGGASFGAPRLVERKPGGREFDLTKDRLTIGRHRESDVFLEDLAVSRLHTTITRDASGRYILRDEGSANGTYVNGQRVSEQALNSGDEVQVGQTVLVFQQ